jgi:REP element-mobilizing transposase RayT
VGRPRRQFAPGIYHLAAHGSDRRHLYLDDDDRVDFLDRLSTTLWTRDIDVLSYVLLGNHYHALVRIPDARLSEALQRLHTEYSRHHNRRYQRGAHLFRAHCLARRIKDDAHLLGAYRYLARNPVEAGLVDDPLDWPWASTRAHAGHEPPAIPLDQRPLQAALDHSPNWHQHYLELIHRTDDPPARADRRRWRGRSKEGEPTVPPLGLT